MQFNEAFEEYMSLYTEAKFTLFPKGKSTNPNAMLGKEEQGEKVKNGKAQGPDSKEEKSEDNETAKKVIKGTAKLAGKSALAFADYMTDGDVSKGIDFVKSSYEDAEGELNPHFKRHDDRQHELRMAKAKAGVDDSPDFMKNDKVEDCETCGCEEKPEYGHLDDKFSEYIDQYESEDAERVDKDRMK